MTIRTAKELRLRRGTTSEHSNFIGAPGEITVDTDLNTIRVHDGVTPAGHLVRGTGVGTVSWTDIINKPTIPADINQLTDNDSLLGAVTTDRLVNGPHQLVLHVSGAGPYVTFPTDDGVHVEIQQGDIAAIGDDITLTSAENAVRLSANATGNRKDWLFGIDGGITFPPLEVDLHNGGVQIGQVLQFGQSGRQAIITGPTPPINANAERLIIQGQRATGTGEGGDVYLWAGDSQINGGDIKIYAGDADDVTTGYGGYVNIDGGYGLTQGGHVLITGGSSNTISGNLTLRAGQGGDHGSVYVSTYGHQWTFDANGVLTLPASGDIKDSNGNSVLSEGGSGPTNEITNTDGTNNYSVSVGTDGVVTMVTSRGGLEFGALPEPGGPSHFHIMRPASENGSGGTDLYFGDDYNYMLQRPAQYGSALGYGVEIGANDRNGGDQHVWRFGTDGILTLPNNMTIDASVSFGIVTIGGENTQIRIDDGGAPPGFSIVTDAANAAHTWRFGTDGILTFPGAVGFQATFGSVEPVGDVLQTVNNLVLSSESEVHIRTNSTSGTSPLWTFGTDGTLTLPQYDTAISQYDGETTFDGGSDDIGVQVNVDKTIYLRVGDNNWVFGAGAGGANILQLPAGGDIKDSTGASVLGGGTPTMISSGITAPGSAVVANETNVSINFSDGGSGQFVFKANGQLQLKAGGDIVDSTGTSLLFDGDYNSLTNKPTIRIAVATGSGPGGNLQADSLALAGLNPVTDIPSTWGGDLILQGGRGGANSDLYGEVRIKSGQIGANYEWHFTTDKKIKLPAGGTIVDSTGANIFVSLTTLKQVVADSTDFADFQSRIAGM